MPRASIDILADLGNRDTKRRLIASIGVMQGMYEVTIRPRRDTRSLRQNAFYWAAVVTPFFEYLRAQDAEVVEAEQAHYWLKAKCLPPKRITDPATGEIVETVADSRTLSVEEFGEYIDRCRHWLDVMFGIVTEEPTRVFEEPQPKSRKAVAHE
jgi:hypothetical protein